MYAQSLSALAFATDKIISTKSGTEKARVQLFTWAEKTVLGIVEFFSARQYQFTTDIPKRKVQIRDKVAQRCFFCVLFSEQKSPIETETAEKCQNSRIVVFRIGAVWNNKNHTRKREVLRDDYKT